MRVKIRLNKEGIYDKYGTGKYDEWWPKVEVPETVTSLVEIVPEKFQQIIELSGPAEDVQKVVDELMTIETARCFIEGRDEVR